MVGLPSASSASSRGAEQLGQRRLGLAPRAQRPAAGSPRWRPARACRSGRRPARPSPASRRARRARRRSTLSPDRADQPGRGARALLDDRGALGHVGLAEVVLGHRRGPRLRTCARMRSTIAVVAHERDAHHLGDGLAGDVVLRRPEPAAHDHRVGCAPSALRSAATMRPRLSPTLVWKCESMPARASCSPIHDELVSTIWPSSSSVPTATTSHRTDAPAAGSCACRRAGTARR